MAHGHLQVRTKEAVVAVAGLTREEELRGEDPAARRLHLDVECRVRPPYCPGTIVWSR